MDVFIDKMHIEIDVDLNQAGNEIINSIAKGFAAIEKADLRIAQLVCNSRMKNFLIEQCEKEVDNIEKWFWGAKYIINESIATPKIILISECCFCEDCDE